jgi:hypothetical protein
MTYDRIPAELRSLKSWVLWKYELVNDKQTKVPYQINGAKANVNEPDNWSSFDDVLKLCDRYSGIGFVFSINDEYCGIDLDYNDDAAIIATQLKIFTEFDSYSEHSPSGNGLHIIVKGTVPAGRRKNSVEVYSSNRFFTMTGNVYHDKPIAERQTLLTQLWEQMKPNASIPTQIIEDQDEKYTDTEIIEQCSKASNGDKFDKLFRGEWNNLYPSQSEADFALIDIIAYYTKNKRQIIRIFHSSVLGKRPKANRADYLAWMINKSFDQTLPPLDFSGFKEALETKLNKVNGHNFNASATTSTIQIPPGLIGQIARFIYAAAPRPVPEIALAAAIGLMAGICGRAYNVSGTGLNQYVLLLAPTGTGKEAMNSGIDRLMAEVQKSVIAASEFIGPSEIASGQALVRYINEHSKCFVSIFDEFGHRLEVMSNPGANSAEKMFKRMLLQLFSSSGRSQMFKPSVFADKDKNTKIAACPSFSLLGYSAPEKFYSALNEDMIADGLLPRFTLIEYDGKRPENNEGHELIRPASELVNQLADLCAYCLKMMHGLQQQWIDVKFDNEALKIAKEFDRYADQQINTTNKEVVRQLWNRAHLKAIKLAGLIAIGCNHLVPTISIEHINYAIDLVNRDIFNLSKKFEKGDVGKNNENRQVNEVIRVIKDYINRDLISLMMYMQNAPEKLHPARIIPYCYLNKRLSSIACFNDGKNKASANLRNAIQVLIDTDRIREMPKEQLRANFGTEQRAYMVKDFTMFND